MNQPCDHTFAALGFEPINKTENEVEVVAALFCTKCGLFRTKILKFNRDLVKMPKEDKNRTSQRVL